MAERHYPGRDPVGENLRYGGPDGEAVRIVGVAADVRYRDRFGTLLLGVFSALAVLLCALGLYGVLAFTVARRTRELAVRVAVGAPVGGLRWLVVRQGMLLLLVGLALGLLATRAAVRALEAFLFGVGGSDPATYVGVAVVLAAVAFAATYLPALRATRVDPQRALQVD